MSSSGALKIRRVTSSFRDPAGFVLLEDERVLRVLSPQGAANYRAAVNAGLFAALEDAGLVLSVKQTDLSSKDLGGEADGLVLEQRRLPFVSYPYEWTFEGLKAAALLHLDVQLLAARFDFSLSDATAFNIQFIGARPVFIDIGSFVPRKSGEYWRGYRQFCEQFLNPLLMQCEVGIAFNEFYRGHTTGVSTEDLASMLRLPQRLRPRIFFHVVLHARFNSPYKASPTAGQSGMSDDALEMILRDLRRWISGLRVRSGRSFWSGYTKTRTYQTQEVGEKLDFVEFWTRKWESASVLDLGSNTGEASHVAARSGARHVVGLEQDWACANTAFLEAAKSGAPVLSLVMNLANPSPSQGWDNKEWQDLPARNRSDTIYALAVLHHLVLGEGIPMQKVLSWICGLGARGIIEFVPADDPMAASLRARMANPAIVYSKEHFLESLERHARVVDTRTVTGSGRCLFAYEVT